MKRQQQNQFLKDAAKEFSFRNSNNANNANDDDSVSLGRLLPATTPQEESEDVSTLSSSASSTGGGEDDSSSSSSSEEQNIMDVEQQVLDSAKDYLYKDDTKDENASQTSLEMEDIVGKLPTIVSPKNKDTRKHYNRYSMTDYHNSKYGIGGDYDDYVLDLNRDLYRRTKFLRHVIGVLTVIAIWSTAVFVKTAYHAYKQMHTQPTR